MRLYTFCNYYLSSIQQGIQTAHVVHELFNKYDEYSPQSVSLKEWSKNHKTIIVLNGGNSSMLREIYELLHSHRNPFPYVKFHEDEESLNSVLTCVGVVLPEKIYNTASITRTSDDLSLINSVHGCDEFEFDLIVALNSCGLAK